MSKLTRAGMTYRAKASDSSETDESRSKKAAYDQDLIDYITKAANTGEKVGKGTKLATSDAIRGYLKESRPIPDPNVAFRDKKMAGIRSHFHAPRRYIDPYAKANPVEHKVEEDEKLVDPGRIRGGTVSKPVDTDPTDFGRVTYGGTGNVLIGTEAGVAEKADGPIDFEKEMYSGIVNGGAVKVEPEEGLGFSGNILMGGKVVGVGPEEEDGDDQSMQR